MTTHEQAGSASPRLLYRMPRAEGAVWMGLPLSALLMLGLTLAAAVGLVTAGAPLPLAVVLLLTAGGTTLVPLAGRTLLGWTGPALRYALTVLTARHQTHATGARRLPLPPECGRLTVDAAGTTSMGVADDGTGCATFRAHTRGRRTTTGPVTLLFEVQHLGGVSLLDADGQDTQLAGWGSCLDALAADPRVRRLQWLTHTRPDTRPAIPTADSTTITRQPAGTGRESLHADYILLANDVTAQAVHHQHLLAVTVHDETTPARETPRAGATNAGGEPLLDVARDLATLLLTSDLLARPLDRTEVGPLLRLLTDPTLPDPRAHSLGQNLETSQDPADQGAWGIRCRRAGWDHTRTDDTWHRSYTVSSWPRLPLPADWLAPLLQAAPPAGTARTLAVHVSPVAPVHAVRQARAAAAKAQLDAADRSRLGLHPGAGGAGSAADETAAQDAAELEAELAAGFRLLRTRTVVTVSAPDLTLLRQATGALRTAAATCRLDLRPLHGQHHYGLVATLPLGLLPGAGR